MAKLTYRKQGEIGKKVPLNPYEKLMIITGFSLALNIMGIAWLILINLRN